MSYKWRPSKSQRKEFAIRMQDPDERSAYEERKEAKAEKRRANSSFNYNSAGGNYVPTEFQYKSAIKLLGNNNLTSEQKDACNQVMYGYDCKEKIHHDYIHIINELERKLNYL